MFTGGSTSQTCIIYGGKFENTNFWKMTQITINNNWNVHVQEFNHNNFICNKYLTT